MNPPSQAHVSAQRALLGLSVGDGFGERFFRFEPATSILASIEARALPDAPWRWTDDTAQAYAFTRHLVQHGGIDQDALAQDFAEIYREDPRRGYGPGAHDLLRGIGAGGDWRVLSRAAFGGTGSMGNGSAMRTAPLGAWLAHAPSTRSFETIAEEAGRAAEVTHPHLEGIAGGVAVTLGAAAIARALPSPEIWRLLLAHTPASHTRERIEAAMQLDVDTTIADAAARLGNGSRVCAYDTVPFCVWSALRHRMSFEAALWATVAALGDRDTTCAIVGGMLASSDDVRIPEEWVRRIEPLPPV